MVRLCVYRGVLISGSYPVDGKCNDDRCDPNVEVRAHKGDAERQKRQRVEDGTGIVDKSVIGLFEVSVNRGPSGLGSVEGASFLRGSYWSPLEGSVGECGQHGCTEAHAAVSVFRGAVPDRGRDVDPRRIGGEGGTRP